MKTVKKILESHGIEAPDDMELGEHYQIEGQGMDLTIEKIGENRLSVAHYYKQRGDLMRDPEIVFNTSNDNWTPVEYTQHPHIYQRDRDGLPEVAEFAQQWSDNLEKQGYLDSRGGR